ncbi:tRNA (adenosine(37)-N6)-threonylcarbamoyltransferase complex dimerization subunit type 1 TsaB [Bacillus gobiensis]|uniref:tRNA (adenosine(37)-N6)-threonylcarbamoyltransferase complex dimerization subunit type 1 TsaB n=1 Tax=Bacillus gobiensis TaxID=1441095 RepID=UPI003D1C95FB
MTILSIDTSNQTLGLALVEGKTIIAEHITYLQKNHSVRAMPGIERLLQDANKSPSEVKKIVVANGPGSYTGVRIGVTIAKTFAWSLQIPVVPVSSLKVLAANGRYFAGKICPLFDARRGQVYTGLYQYEDGKLLTIEEDQNVLMKDWLEQLKKENMPVLFLGHDVSVYQDEIQEALGEKACFGQEGLSSPRPSELAFLGKDVDPESTHTLVPNYIRLAEAEANWLKRQQK